MAATTVTPQSLTTQPGDNTTKTTVHSDRAFDMCIIWAGYNGTANTSTMLIYLGDDDIPLPIAAGDFYPISSPDGTRLNLNQFKIKAGNATDGFTVHSFVHTPHVST